MIIDFKPSNGGGGTGGTTNYNELSNKPQINSVVLSGNVSSDQLGIASDKIQPVSATPQTASAGTVFAVASGSEVSLKQAYSIPYCEATEISNSERKWVFNTNFSLPSGETPLCSYYFDVDEGDDVYVIAGLGPNGFYLKYSTDQTNWTYDLTGETSYDEWRWDIPAGQWYLNIDLASYKVYINNNAGAPTSATMYAIAGPAVTDYVSYQQNGGSVKWFNWESEFYMIARERPTGNGDYLCHVNNSQAFAGLNIEDGVITGSSYGMTQIGGNSGIWVKTVDYLYNFVAWIQDGYLYWRTNFPIDQFDAYDTGSAKEGGIQML